MELFHVSVLLLVAHDQIGTFSQTVKENAPGIVMHLPSEDAKIPTSAPVRVADFTSKIGQRHPRAWRLPFLKYLGEELTQKVKETIICGEALWK